MQTQTCTKKQFGLWDSPISPRSLSHSKRLDAARWDTDGETLVWLEGRSGQGVLVAQVIGGDAPRDLTTDISVRAEVGYGGGDFTVFDGYVYFVQHKTGRILRQPISEGSAQPITPAQGNAASPVVSPDGRWLVYVHHDDDNVDCLAIVDAAGQQWPQILAQGHDFYMQPRWSPDGKNVAWIAWDHPNMPWDGTLLELAPVLENDHGLPPSLGEVQTIAGAKDVAIFQPEFLPDAMQLAFVSDETGWGRLAIQNIGTGARRWLTPEGVELANPAWKQDLRTFAISNDGHHVVAAFNESGFQKLMKIDISSSEATRIEALSDYSAVEQVVSASGGWYCFIGSGPKISPRLVAYNVTTDHLEIVARSTGETVALDSLAMCEAISWKTAGDETAHGLYYPPTNTQFDGTGKPPLIVWVHGGPTSQVRASWLPDAQFFATRGYAVLWVNYRGGTGYGREYMLRLRGNWGICDVEDSISGAKHLIDADKVDPDRTVIMGGSAGGFTVLQAMTQQPEAFAAGINLFGVSDQFHLAAATHKFERRYLDTILGPLPEAARIYRERSPLFHADKICRPLAVFQGDIDQVVPRHQSDAVVEILRRNGVPHEYHVYEDEGHGWRRQDTIEHFYTAVDAFLRKHVIFK